MVVQISVSKKVKVKDTVKSWCSMALRKIMRVLIFCNFEVSYLFVYISYLGVIILINTAPSNIQNNFLRNMGKYIFLSYLITGIVFCFKTYLCKNYLIEIQSMISQTYDVLCVSSSSNNVEVSTSYEPKKDTTVSVTVAGNPKSILETLALSGIVGAGAAVAKSVKGGPLAKVGAFTGVVCAGLTVKVANSAVEMFQSSSNTADTTATKPSVSASFASNNNIHVKNNFFDSYYKHMPE